MEKQNSILIVDDDLGMLKTLEYIFTELGYDVVAVGDGVKAVERLKERTFDLALADLRMPDMNGVEVLREIKRIAPDTTTLMMTAYTMHELVEEAKKEGAKTIFTKPLDLDYVISYTENLRNKKLKPPKAERLELSELLKMMEDKEREIGTKDSLIDQLKEELQEIKKNQQRLYDELRRKTQSERIHTLLKPKQLGLFKILSQSERNYDEILAAAQSERLNIRDLAALRLQISRLDKKLTQETNYKIEKIRRQGCLYLKINPL
jgi:CheY-like chemotaxis protein